MFGSQNGPHGSPGDGIACFCSNIEGSKGGANRPMSQEVRQTSYGLWIGCQTMCTLLSRLGHAGPSASSHE